MTLCSIYFFFSLNISTNCSKKKKRLKPEHSRNQSRYIQSLIALMSCVVSPACLPKKLPPSPPPHLQILTSHSWWLHNSASGRLRLCSGLIQTACRLERCAAPRCLSSTVSSSYRGGISSSISFTISLSPPDKPSGSF